jgi:hypothetical protein
VGGGGEGEETRVSRAAGMQEEEVRSHVLQMRE